jgi:hypothetical protein
MQAASVTVPKHPNNIGMLSFKFWVTEMQKKKEKFQKLTFFIFVAAQNLLFERFYDSQLEIKL